MKLYIIIIIICSSIIALAGSGGKRPPASDNPNIKTSGKVIIAKVADKEITLKDFLERSEYTLRAPYCKGNTNNDKNIILNTLIAEKLLALDSDNSELLRDKRFLNFITGRREQKMRELLYFTEGVQKVKLDTSEIKTVFTIAGRTYNIEYFNISDQSAINNYLTEYASKDSSFELFFKAYGKADSIRTRKAGWGSAGLPSVHKALFSAKLKKDQVLGPVPINDTTSLLLKIIGWNDRVVISEKDIKSRYDDVVEKLTFIKADSIYESFVLNLMADKKLEFNVDNLNKLIKILAPFYLNRKEESKNEFLDLVYDNLELPDLSKSTGEYSEISDLPVIEIDENSYTIAELKNEIDKHPPVFRKDNQNRSFAGQLRLAIVDLVRDIYLTNKSYKNGLDKTDIVKHYEQSWHDAGVALFQRNKYLMDFDLDEDNPSNVFEQYLNPLMKNLFKKYSDHIKINVEEYNRIRLTRTDMFTTQSNVPYPIYVPSFPQLTTYNRLDYGTKMEN